MLRSTKFKVDYWEYTSRQFLNKDFSSFSRQLQRKFDDYAERKIVCTRVDLVAFGVGGLMAENFLLNDKEYENINLSPITYKQGAVRRLITIATPHYGTPWADILSGAWEGLSHDSLLENIGFFIDFEF